MGRKHIKYTKELLEPIVKKSTSWAMVCRFLELRPSGSSQYHIQRKTLSFNIDVSHFKGCGWSAGRIFKSKTPFDEWILSPRLSSDKIRKRLIKDKIKEEKCEICGLSEWMGEKIRFELDHKDGDHYNNKIENLQIVCPTCHSQKTYRNKDGRKKTTSVSEIYKRMDDYDTKHQNKSWEHISNNSIKLFCKICGKELVKHKQKKYCSYNCLREGRRKVVRPTKEILEKMVWDKPASKLSEELGVSDKTIEKWCKGYGIDKPTRGYWEKKYHGKLEIFTSE